MNSRYKIRSCQEEEFPGQVAKADCFMTNLTKTDKFDWLPIGRPFVIGVMNPPTFTEEYANLKKKKSCICQQNSCKLIGPDAECKPKNYRIPSPVSRLLHVKRTTSLWLLQGKEQSKLFEEHPCENCVRFQTDPSWYKTLPTNNNKTVRSYKNTVQ